jgi:hypothetical protein
MRLTCLVPFRLSVQNAKGLDCDKPLRAQISYSLEGGGRGA